MSTFYIQTTGNAGYSGTTDSDTPIISGIAGAGTGVAVSGTTVTFPAGTVLTGITTTAGLTQDAIYIADATNSNQKIFKISAVAGSGGATPTCTVTVAPTGTIATSAWAVGGRHVLTNASIEGAVTAGDVVQLNDSPASVAGIAWTFRNSGDSTNGFVKLIGKSGVRPVLSNTTTASTISSAASYSWIENLEISQGGVSGNGIALSGVGSVTYNVKVSLAGGTCISLSTTGGHRVIGCNLTGAGANGLASSQAVIAIGNYIHGIAGTGVLLTSSAPAGALLNNIISGCGDRGVYFNASIAANTTTPFTLFGNTIYGNGNSGIEVSDPDLAVTIMNNILMNNGDAAGEYNVEWVAGTAELISFHGYNDFSKSNNNLFGLTVNAQVANSEITSDPLLNDPADGDFRPTFSSPAIGSGTPQQFLGAVGSISYTDMGALQVIRSAPGNIILGA